jgi:2-polyprenyl-3-methyl-5-hydroxy-6-metoxy-1,4-benzoquinol methylase
MESWKARVYASYNVTTAAVNGRRGDDAWDRDRREYVRRYRRFLPPDKRAPILDVGAGDGGFLAALQSMGYTRVEGVDLSSSQLQAAAARGVTGVTLAPALEYLKQRPAQYDVITALNVLEHQTRPELFELLDAIRLALRPGGRLLAVVPNAKGLFGAHVRYADITHELSFAPTTLSQICAVAGFEQPAISEQRVVVHGPVSLVRWTMWQAIRAGLLLARLAEGADWRWPVFTQDMVFVTRRPVGPGA